MFLRVSLLALLLPFVAACTTLYTDEPLGQVAALKPEEWNGLWLDVTKFGGQAAFLGTRESVVLSISVLDAEKGVITSRAYSCEPVLPASVEQHLTQLRRSEDGRWFFPIGVARDAQGEFKPQRADHGYAYNAFLLRPSAGDMISNWFNDSAIDALIKQGALPGHMTHGDNPKVFLGRISADHYKVLLSEERPIVEWKLPLVLKKLPPELDPCKKGAQVK